MCTGDFTLLWVILKITQCVSLHMRCCLRQSGFNCAFRHTSACVFGFVKVQRLLRDMALWGSQGFTEWSFLVVNEALENCLGQFELVLLMARPRCWCERKMCVFVFMVSVQFMRILECETTGDKIKTVGYCQVRWWRTMFPKDEFYSSFCYFKPRDGYRNPVLKEPRG